MISKKNKFHNVGHSFIEIDGKIIFISKEGDYIVKDLQNNKVLYTIQKRFSKLGKYSENEFYLVNDSISWIVNLEHFSILEIPLRILAIKGSRLLCDEYKNGVRSLVLNIKNNEALWKVPTKPGKFMLLENNILINTKYLNDSIINCYNVENGEILWINQTTSLGTWRDYDKSERATEISKILGVLDDFLYIYLNSGRVLVLDIKSGEKKHLIENDKNLDQTSFHGMFMNSMELDKHNKKLIQLFNQRYTEVDLETGFVKQTHLDDMKELNISNMSNFVYDSKLIYFSDRNEYKLGALNRTTLKIDWLHVLADSKTIEVNEPRFGRDLMLNGHNLYVLDNKHTLHIFEIDGLISSELLYSK